jgi:hypothetical protein
VEAERVKTPGFNSRLIRQISVKYRDKITTHPNELASALLEGEEPRRLKRFKPPALTSRFS